MNTHTTEQLMSLPKAARQLDVSLRAIYRLIAREELPPPVKVGRSSKLCQSDLDLYMQTLKNRRT
jgi:excisionase family DNA binding protein